MSKSLMIELIDDDGTILMKTGILKDGVVIPITGDDVPSHKLLVAAVFIQQTFMSVVSNGLVGCGETLTEAEKNYEQKKAATHSKVGHG